MQLVSISCGAYRSAPARLPERLTQWSTRDGNAPRRREFHSSCRSGRVSLPQRVGCACGIRRLHHCPADRAQAAHQAPTAVAPLTDRLRPLWDFDDLDATEARFRAQIAKEQDDAGRAEVLSQLARVEGLRGDFDACARLLDEAEPLAGDDARAN